MHHVRPMCDDAPNLSGCARTEGFRRLTAAEKRMHMVLSVGTTEERDAARVKALIKSEESRAARAEQRKLREAAEELASVVTSVDLLKYNQLKSRRKKLRFARSRIHGWGLFTLEDIPVNEMVVEYVGELVRPIIADRREVAYTEQGLGSSYLFRLSTTGIIDATKKGAVGRFMNHSCNVCQHTLF